MRWARCRQARALSDKHRSQQPELLERRLCHTMEANLVANGVATMREQVLRRIRNVLGHNHGRPHDLGTHLGDHVGQNAARRDKVNANAILKDLFGK